MRLMEDLEMGASADYRLDEQNRRLTGRARGYEDECCAECGSFTLVSNGNELKCDTCDTSTNVPQQNDGECA